MHIAMEIDQPFGADANDLPIKAALYKWFSRVFALVTLVASRGMHPVCITRQ